MQEVIERRSWKICSKCKSLCVYRRKNWLRDPVLYNCFHESVQPSSKECFITFDIPVECDSRLEQEVLGPFHEH